MAQVEHVAEELVLQLRVAHGGDGQVRIARRHVRAQPRRELADVRRHLHYQHAPAQQPSLHWYSTLLTVYLSNQSFLIPFKQFLEYCHTKKVCVTALKRDRVDDCVLNEKRR